MEEIPRGGEILTFVLSIPWFYSYSGSLWHFGWQVLLGYIDTDRLATT
jgi:hypothetical protein